MPAIKVVLVSPMHDGNVGAVARSMANFGFKELCMVNPCELTEEAFKRAKHAGYILTNARVVPDFEEAIKGCDLVVGTSGIVTAGPRHFVRIPEAPRSFAGKIKDYEGTVALLFGPEDLGLSQEQLERCDMLVHIPSDPEYPVLNLSHSVAVVLYELFLTKDRPYHPAVATLEEKEKLFEFFHSLLVAIDYPEYRRDKTEIMFRRMMGRAVPTKWEFYTIMGVIGDAYKIIEGKKRLPK